MRVYEAIVKGLEGLGVEAMFGGAGENDASLMIALKHSRKIRGIITRHEQAASFMACGYAMYTGKLGVCFATAGPGAFNLFSGLAVAMADSYPVLAISGYARREWRGKGGLNETSGAGRTPDSLKMFEACTKRSWLLGDIARTCDVLEEAVNVALEGRPGPVHITVPEDLTLPHLSAELRELRVQVRPVTPDPAAVAEASGALARALADRKRILLLAGFGAVRSRAGDVVRRLVERYQIPVVTTLDGKGIIPERHPLAVGVFSDSGHSEAWKAFLDAEVVLAVGNSFAQHATFNFRPDLLEGKTLLHVNIDPAEIGKVYRTDHRVVGDARLALEALLAELARVAPPAAPRPVARHDHDADQPRSLDGKIHPARLAQAISRLLPENGVVLGDAGAHSAWLAYHLELQVGQHFRKPGGFGPMAFGVNGALGVKCAEPDRAVVVGCGDGGYLLSGFELLTAVQQKLPVVWMIFDDREFKLIKIFQVSAYGESGLVEFENPDYAGYARACGALGWRVETIEQFEQAFREALASGRPAVIDAVITRLALPHYSPTPHGTIAGIIELLEQKLRGDPAAKAQNP
jgi:acetolactate synthase-1/2/3 large subunit